VPSFTGTSGLCNTQANFGSIMVDCSSSCFSSATTMKVRNSGSVQVDLLSLRVWDDRCRVPWFQYEHWQGMIVIKLPTPGVRGGGAHVGFT
jgi:hypothetical protein